MRYPKVEIDSCDEHVGLEANFVYTWRWKRDGESNHAHQGWRGLSRKYELRPQTTQQQYDLCDVRVWKKYILVIVYRYETVEIKRTCEKTIEYIRIIARKYILHLPDNLTI